MRVYDEQEATILRPYPWMIELVKLNPSYVFWGPHEDYMYTKDGGWNSPIMVDTWTSMGIGLDELNEVVNFYFYLYRRNHTCPACDGSGMNPETNEISRSFYDFERRGNRWVDKITADEVEALAKEGRLRDFMPYPCHYNDESQSWVGWVDGEKVAIDPPVLPAPAMVNAQSHRHDAINRWILIKQRALRLGVWGKCQHCEDGVIYDEEVGRLGLVLWLIHLRKGASRGVDIQNIEQADIEGVVAFLQEAASRNAQRFAKIVEFVHEPTTIPTNLP